jgi:hypothetical protein
MFRSVFDHSSQHTGEFPHFQNIDHRCFRYGTTFFAHCSLYTILCTPHAVLLTFAFENILLQTCPLKFASAHLPLRIILCTLSSALCHLYSVLYSLTLAHLPLHVFFCTLPLHTFPAHCAMQTIYATLTVQCTLSLCTLVSAQCFSKLCAKHFLCTM